MTYHFGKLAIPEIMYRSLLFYFQIFFESVTLVVTWSYQCWQNYLLGWSSTLLDMVILLDGFLFPPPVISICQTLTFSSYRFSLPYLTLVPHPLFTISLLHLTSVTAHFPDVAYRLLLSIFCGLIIFPNIKFLLRTQSCVLFSLTLCSCTRWPQPLPCF